MLYRHFAARTKKDAAANKTDYSLQEESPENQSLTVLTHGNQHRPSSRNQPNQPSVHDNTQASTTPAEKTGSASLHLPSLKVTGVLFCNTHVTVIFPSQPAHPGQTWAGPLCEPCSLFTLHSLVLYSASTQIASLIAPKPRRCLAGRLPAKKLHLVTTQLLVPLLYPQLSLPLSILKATAFAVFEFLTTCLLSNIWGPPQLLRHVPSGQYRHIRSRMSHHRNVLRIKHSMVRLSSR